MRQDGGRSSERADPGGIRRAGLLGEHGCGKIECVGSSVSFQQRRADPNTGATAWSQGRTETVGEVQNLGFARSPRGNELDG